MATCSPEDVVGSPHNPSSPVVRLQYKGAVYDNSIRILPNTSSKEFHHAAKSLANLPEHIAVSLLRLDHQGELVTDVRALKDGELLEIMEGSPEDRK